MSGGGVLRDGALALEISTAVVRELVSTTGRGPLKAKTTVGDNAVSVVLQDTLTRGERNLVDAGESDAVLGLRRLWQTVTRDSCGRRTAELTPRKVGGVLSEHHPTPGHPRGGLILEGADSDRATRTRAVIETRENESTVELSVRDEGEGFDPAIRPAGFGLLGIRERVGLLHGAVQIESTPGDGTTVSASLPGQRRSATAATAAPDPTRRTGTGVVG